MNLTIRKMFGLTLYIGFITLIYTQHSYGQFFTKGNSRFGKGVHSVKPFNFFSTIQIGYSYVFSPTTTMTHQFSGMFNNAPIVPIDKTIEHPELTSSINAHVAGYLPLAMIGSSKANVSFTYGLSYLSTELKDVTVYYTNDLSYKASYAQTNIGMPIGVAFKYGGEATLNKQDRISFGVGASIAPSYIMYQYKGLSTIDESKIKVIPELTAEVGIFAGLEWKIRGSVIPITQSYFDATSGDAKMEVYPTNTYIAAKTGPYYSLGIAIMPFSGKWDSHRW